MRKRIAALATRAISACERERKALSLRLIRPGLLGCIALGIAVFLWGYGYRLSQYQARRDPSSRLQMAKLWTESRHSVVPSKAKPLSQAVQVAGSSPRPWMLLESQSRFLAASSCNFIFTSLPDRRLGRAPPTIL